MMKKVLLTGLAVAGAALGYIGYLFLGPGTAFNSDRKPFYVHPREANKAAILADIESDSIVIRPGQFAWLADKMGYFNSIKPGKYTIEKGASVYSIIKLLRSGRQDVVKLVLGKMRKPDDLARRIGKQTFESDSTALQFLTNADSLKTFGLTPDTWMLAVIPNTYHITWSNTTGEVFRKLNAEKNKWWKNAGRAARLKEIGYSSQEVHILASIVEEETNKNDDKPLIASVYLNRLKAGMPLQADPTVRFGLKDFESNRVTFQDLKSPSPYNTYLNKGLPPGPICTPSVSSLEAVLEARPTSYLYFVAKPDFSGYSIFNSTYAEHMKDARVYQDSLKAWLVRKAAREKEAELLKKQTEQQ